MSDCFSCGKSTTNRVKKAVHIETFMNKKCQNENKTILAMYHQGLTDTKGGEGMYLAPGKIQIHSPIRLTVAKCTLSVISTNAIQTGAVTIISYKPLSLYFAR